MARSPVETVGGFLGGERAAAAHVELVDVICAWQPSVSQDRHIDRPAVRAHRDDRRHADVPGGTSGSLGYRDSSATARRRCRRRTGRRSRSGSTRRPSCGQGSRRASVTIPHHRRRHVRSRHRRQHAARARGRTAPRPGLPVTYTQRAFGLTTRRSGRVSDRDRRGAQRRQRPAAVEAVLEDRAAARIGHVDEGGGPGRHRAATRARPRQGARDHPSTSSRLHRSCPHRYPLTSTPALARRSRSALSPRAWSTPRPQSTRSRAPPASPDPVGAGAGADPVAAAARVDLSAPFPVTTRSSPGPARPRRRPYRC